ncbi:MAG: hypothetical protein ACJA01_001795 [Saprospiraceae bacterium]|jgi:hypothetical protein
MPRLLLIALVLGGALIFITKVIFEFWGGISGTRSAVFRDISLLRGLISSYALEPWNHNEIDLISRRAEVNSKKELTSDTKYGVYYSIYEEPVLAFAMRTYQHSEKKLIVFRYNNDAYTMIKQRDKVTVRKGKTEIGVITLDKGIQLAIKEDNVFIDSRSTAGLLPVELNGDYSMSVIAHQEGDLDQYRVLKKVDPHKEDEGELLLMAVAYALIDEHI